MDLDENICMCFHVSLRKVKKFIRLEKPVRASQISQCYGAGTGCGWCRPFLEKLLTESNSAAEAVSAAESSLPIESPAEYQQESPLDDWQAKGIKDLSPNAYANLRNTYLQKNQDRKPN